MLFQFSIVPTFHPSFGAESSYIILASKITEKNLLKIELSTAKFAKTGVCN